ncbi:MAG TPA: EAL domain-containing protein [Acidimicrobiales bacterium]|nr:EAL domain-containing protein [Acidimicrobiales bacterium]
MAIDAASGPVTAFDVVVGRQPIFDRDRVVVGYELLFRHLDGETDRAGAEHGLMTAEVVFGTVSLGVDRLVGDKLAFVNADRAVLTGAVPIVLPPGRTVVEVLETVRPDDEVLAGCRRLARRGFVLALDDFEWFPGCEPLLELASIVKLDVLAHGLDELPALLERCRGFGVDLLAEKVETPEQLDACRDLGFDYFQGYLLSRPKTVSGRAVAPDAAARLELVAKLAGGECDLAEIEAIVERVPAAAHQILGLAGIGAANGLRRPVRSIRDALVLVGWRSLQSWAALLALVDRGDPRSEGSVTALVRARMCELLAARTGAGASGAGFAAGMVSTFDVLLGVELGAVVDALGIDEELRIAALGGDSPIGRIVADVTDFQFGRHELACRSGASPLALQGAWAEAIDWAVQVVPGA